MRRMLAALSAALLLTLTAAPATAHDFPIAGHIFTIHTTAGGVLQVGLPIGAEQKTSIVGVAGYAQRFAAPTAVGGVNYVVWNRLGGGWATSAAHPDPRLAKVIRERDALIRSGFRAGLVFRSAEVHTGSTSDRLHMAGVLRGGLLIDLRGSGTRDPNLPGVTEVRRPMTGTSNPATFVTKSSDRAQLARVLRAIAAEDRAVWIHCHYGRDRTGWAVTTLILALGGTPDAALAEYLRSSGTSAVKFRAGLAAVRARYGTTLTEGTLVPGFGAYLTEGLGLTAADLTRLRDRLAA